MQSRIHNWPFALAAEIEKASSKTFEYGAFDCALFAADCITAITGVDPAAALRGYHSRADAYTLITQHGSFEKLITHTLGIEPVHPSRAQRGDVVLVAVKTQATAADKTMGVCIGSKVLIPKSPSGLHTVKLSTASHAWRIS